MDSNVKSFIKDNKDLIIDRNFKLLNVKMQKSLTHQMQQEVWAMLKKVTPISCKNVTNKTYENYIEIDTKNIPKDILENINSQIEIDLPDMTFHEILKIVSELYVGVLDKARVKMLLGMADISCHKCKLSIASPYDVTEPFKIMISYIELGSTLTTIIKLETIPNSRLKVIPGLCVCYDMSKLIEQLNTNKLDILSTLNEVREGRI